MTSALVLPDTRQAIGSPPRSATDNSVLIIGGGVAGLCAGVYAAKAGFDVEILEMGTSLGGLATSWKRGEYTFETCLHWLLGSNPSSAFHALWQEVFDIDSLTFIDSDEFVRVESADGASAALYRDVDRTEAAMLQVAPEDHLPIRRLAAGIRRLRRCELPVAQDTVFQQMGQMLRSLPYLAELRAWSRLTCAQFAAEFRNPLLRRLLDGGATPNLSAIALVFSLVWASKGDAGYPIGGSQAVIRGIEGRFRALGGRIRYNARVRRVVVSNQRATGVELTSGETLPADWVISAADGHATVFEWIPERYRDARATRPYERLAPFPSYLQVSFGVKQDLSREPAHFIKVLATPIVVDPASTLDHLQFRVFHFDPTFAPPGKTAVTCFLPTYNYEHWVRMWENDRATYQAEKRRIAAEVIKVFDGRIPGTERATEEIDVSTPATVVRLTGNWKGSMEGFVVTPNAPFRPLPNRVSGLDHFFMVGQWVLPGGGLPAGLMTGRDAIRALCREVDRPFPHARA